MDEASLKALAFPWGCGELRLGFSCLRGSSVPFSFLPLLPRGLVCIALGELDLSLLKAAFSEFSAIGGTRSVFCPS